MPADVPCQFYLYKSFAWSVIISNQPVPCYIVGMKTNFTTEQLQQIISLFNQDLGSRKIADLMSVNRSTIIRAYKQLGLDSASKKTPRFAYKAIKKCCKICEITKNVDNFRKRIRKSDGRISYECYCLNCEASLNNERLKIRAKRLRQTDPNFVIRRSVSYFIWKGLKNNSSSKNGKSCLDYLPYSIDELRVYLEKQFEPWMTWNNHGNYNPKIWNDNDQTTWTWQIDHIIPQSDLPYILMTDTNFNKCWALKNLRPLSSKQNHHDGVNKIRHMTV